MAKDWSAGESSDRANRAVKSAIHINPNHETLHAALGVPAGQKLTAAQEAIKPGDSEALRKKKQFAINSRQWNH